MQFKYKKFQSLSERKELYTRLQEKYPGKIAVICEKMEKCEMPAIATKYLIPFDITVGQFMHILRKRATLAPENAFFLFVNNQIPSSSALMSQVYAQHKDEDGFLYMSYSTESTFG